MSLPANRLSGLSSLASALTTHIVLYTLFTLLFQASIFDKFFLLFCFLLSVYHAIWKNILDQENSLCSMFPQHLTTHLHFGQGDPDWHQAFVSDQTYKLGILVFFLSALPL